MKKHIKCLLFLLFISCFSYGQQDVIVLVDVSKSIRQSHFVEARMVVKNVLQGNNIGNTNFDYKSFPGNKLRIGQGTPLFISGKKLLIIPFGEREFWDKNYGFNKITNFNSYFENNYPQRVTDNKTYLKLAKIKAASTAKNNGVNNYILVLVSDNISDDYGSGGKPNYTTYQSNAESNFKTVGNPYVEIKQAQITYKNDENYKIIFHTVNIKDWKPYTPSIPVGSKGSIEKNKCELKFSSFANGKRDNPKIVKNNEVKFRWSSENKIQGAKFKISISSTSGKGANKVSKSGLTSNTYSTNLPDDEYKVLVNAKGCKPDVTYIKVETSSGGGGFLPWLFAFIILGGIGYYLYQRNQQKEIEKIQFGEPDDSMDVGHDASSGSNGKELDGF